VGEAELIGIALLHGDELLAVLFVELDCLEGHEVEVGECAVAGQVELDHVLALLVAVVDAVVAEQRGELFVVVAGEWQRDGLAAEAEQLYEVPAVVPGAGVEGGWHCEEVALRVFLLEGQHLMLFLVLGEHQIADETAQRLQFWEVEHDHF
jgi:hypothetical protein